MSLAELIEHGYVEESEEPLSPLDSWQRYRVYPSRCVESVHWAITGKCNFRCRHCLVSAPGANHPQLPLSDLEHIADEIARCGVKFIDVTGGEPLVRNDFPEFVKMSVWKEHSSDYALSYDELWDVYRDFIPRYFEDGSPIDVELDGFFLCKKGSTDYKVTYQHHTKDGSPWDKLPYCESIRYNPHICPDERVAPCMGFSDTVLGNRFPSVMEEHLGDILLRGHYHDVVETKLSDLLAKNPECAECEHWLGCTGGCMLSGMGDDGDYLVPDPQICWFHKNVGEAAVCEVVDAALERLGKK